MRRHSIITGVAVLAMQGAFLIALHFILPTLRDPRSVTIRPYRGPRSFTWELDRIKPEVGPTQSKFVDVATVEGLPAEVVMADTAYDADPLRQAIAAKGAIAVIPNNPSRALKYPLDKHLYAQRHPVRCCFSKLKQFRRVATRFEKTARNYRAVVTRAAIILWMR